MNVTFIRRFGPGCAEDLIFFHSSIRAAVSGGLRVLAALAALYAISAFVLAWVILAGGGLVGMQGHRSSPVEVPYVSVVGDSGGLSQFSFDKPARESSTSIHAIGVEDSNDTLPTSPGGFVFLSVRDTGLRSPILYTPRLAVEVFHKLLQRPPPAG